MIMNPSKILFLTTLFSGSMLSISSESWFSAWMGLEINLLSFIPIMSNSSNQRSVEATLKYFLTQVLASVILMMGVILNSLTLGITETTILMETSLFTINTALLLKMGAAPLHLWFPMVTEGLTWFNSVILMTWQKLAPLALICYNMMENLIIMSALLSAAIGSLGGLNQTSLRKIMAYSSINHMSWMLMGMLSSENLWLLYFLFYVALSTSVILVFYWTNILHINQIHDSIKNNLTKKMILGMNMLSLGGLPPFLGFLPKWLIIQNMMETKWTLMTFFMIMAALLTLFYYLRMIYTSSTISSSTKKWLVFSNFTKNNLSVILMSSLSLMSFPVMLNIIWLT